MNLFRNKYKRRAALVTILVHLLAIFIFYSFGLKYMDPKIEEGIAIEFGYVEEGMGEEITQTEEVQTEEVEQIQDVEVSSPEEQTEISEEVVTQDVEDAPVINEEKEEETEERRHRCGSHGSNNSGGSRGGWNPLGRSGSGEG